MVGFEWMDRKLYRCLCFFNLYMKWKYLCIGVVVHVATRLHISSYVYVCLSLCLSSLFFLLSLEDSKSMSIYLSVCHSLSLSPLSLSLSLSLFLSLPPFTLSLSPPLILSFLALGYCLFRPFVFHLFYNSIFVLRATKWLAPGRLRL